MRQCTSKIKLIYTYIFLCNLLSIHFLQAQEFKNVDFFLKDSTKGKANYSLSKNKRNGSKNGQFQFESTLLDTTSNIIKSVQYDGIYKDNIKNQKWKYSFLELNSNENAFVKDFELVRETTGTVFSIVGNFNEGKPDGNWNVTKNIINNSKIGDTLFYLDVNFKKGELIENLFCYNDKLQINGQFDNQSFLDGQWIVKHKSAKDVKVYEHRIYENGIFKAHYFMIQDQQVIVQHIGLDVLPDLENEIWVDVPVSEDYFNIISFANTGYNIKNVFFSKSYLDSLVGLTNEISKRALVSYGDFRGTQVWNQLDGSDNFKYPVFKLRKHEFTALEKREIKETVSRIDRMQQKINMFLNNSQLDVILFTYKELNQYYQWIKIHKDISAKLLEFSNKINHPAFEFVNRRDFFEIIKPNLVYPNQFEYQFKNENFIAESTINDLKPIQTYDWIQIKNYISVIEKDIDASLEKANVYLSRYQKETALKSLENELIKKRDLIIELFNPQSTLGDFNEYHLKISPQIIALTNQTFVEYASKSLENKKEEIDIYMKCMDDILLYYEKCKEIPRRRKRLDELYTRTTFNPYVFANMDERVKARLYETYEEVLLPYFLDGTNENMNCNQVLNSALNFEMLYRKMVDLREQDTKILERQLRRVKNPMEAIEILNLDIN